MKIPMEQILRLTIAERIELIGAIWESIESTQDLPPVTAAQKAEIERRLQLYRTDPERTRAWDAVKERLEKDE